MKTFTLRLPDDLHAVIEASAEKSDRSLNADMIERLRRSFDQEARLAETEAILRRVLNEQAPGRWPAPPVWSAVQWAVGSSV